MRAYVIKWRTGGYSGEFINKSVPLNEVALFPNKKKANESWCEGDKILPIEINIIR